MRWLVLSFLLAACSDPSSPADIDAAASPDAGKDALCASTFGNVLTNAHGRVDGTIVAVVAPGNQACAMPNGDHVIVQVMMGGAVYRMVVNVLSTGTDPNILIRTLSARLPPPAFAEGWHPGLSLDYALDLGVHTTDASWESVDMATATARISDPIVIGAPIAVYATSSGGANAASTHLIHRNGVAADGALVLDPTGPAPQWLLFHFADQTF
jgi:hypothetical protein